MEIIVIWKSTDIIFQTLTIGGGQSSGDLFFLFVGMDWHDGRKGQNFRKKFLFLVVRRAMTTDFDGSLTKIVWSVEYIVFCVFWPSEIPEIFYCCILIFSMIFFSFRDIVRSFIDD